MTWRERLSNLDAMFLDLEDRAAHMHVGSVSIYEGSTPPYDELVALIASRLDRVPRYRQRLAFVPLGLDRPSWVDDPDLDLEYHVRHTALPPPGGAEPLKRLAGRVFGQQLDRGKPLWEMWLIDGFAPNRFAILSKAHHCMIDGISGVDLATILHDAARDDTAPPPPAQDRRWAPRPPPTGAELALQALRGRVTHPVSLAMDALHPSTPGRRKLRELVAGVKPLLGISQLGPAPDCSLNRPVGPHRRWDMASLDLAAVKQVRAAFGTTVNDVLLAVISGALRELLASRGERPRGDLRALVPVSVRAPEARNTYGNQVTAVFCPLPIGDADPVVRLQSVSRAMRGLKEGRQAVGALALTHLRGFAPPTLAAQAARLAVSSRWFNVVVTNIPGPQHPLFLLGHRLVECYPAVPLAANQTIGVALLSYDGRIGIGLLGDADLARDLPVLARAIPEDLRDLTARAAAS
ncbi:MAG TPA: wax ester/triacylglycerol synthase family O-acyltransferase [Anaeromyxobacteraceae bacterium]|nr:wax ester/triacylglycerol synthase family O-acyltransferase [Anaeromyxobacteraceae bacterium]